MASRRQEENQVPIQVQSISSLSTLPAGYTGYIQQIWTEHQGIKQTIYDRDLHFGSSPTSMPKAYIPVGASYEVHVEAFGSSPQNGWAQAVTLRVSGLLSDERYRTQCGLGQTDRYVLGATDVRMHGAWNVGYMVEQTGIVNFVGVAIKHWLSDQWTTSEPPEEDW